MAKDNYIREEFHIKEAQMARYNELKVLGTPHLIKYTNSVPTGQFRYRRYTGGGRVQKRFLGRMAYFIAYQKER